MRRAVAGVDDWNEAMVADEVVSISFEPGQRLAVDVRSHAQPIICTSTKRALSPDNVADLGDELFELLVFKVFDIIQRQGAYWCPADDWLGV